MLQEYECKSHKYLIEAIEFGSSLGEILAVQRSKGEHLSEDQFAINKEQQYLMVDMIQKLYNQSIIDNFFWSFCASSVYLKLYDDRLKFFIETYGSDELCFIKQEKALYGIISDENYKLYNNNDEDDYAISFMWSEADVLFKLDKFFCINNQGGFIVETEYNEDGSVKTIGKCYDIDLCGDNRSLSYKIIHNQLVIKKFWEERDMALNSKVEEVFNDAFFNSRYAKYIFEYMMNEFTPKNTRLNRDFSFLFMKMKEIQGIKAKYLLSKEKYRLYIYERYELKVSRVENKIHPSSRVQLEALFDDANENYNQLQKLED